MWTTSEPIYEAYKTWCGYKVGEVVDIRYFGRQLKKFCGGFEPKRGKTKDRKSTTAYKGLIFDNIKCKAALEALQISMSLYVSIKSLSNLNEEEKEQSQQISMYLLSQSNLWNEIIENFGETSIRKEPQNSLCNEDAIFIETIETIETSISSEPAKDEPNRDISETLIETPPMRADLLSAEEQTRAKEEHFRDQAEKHTGPARAGRAAHRGRHDKHTCSRCGKHDDIPFVMHDYNGYICEPCRRDGPPTKADSQTKLEGEAGA
jgi:hypothetical protein